MQMPSVRVMRIVAADHALFEHLMGRAGLRIVSRDNNPLNTSVQAEAVDAIASAICEDSNTRVRLSPYHRQLKEMAEKLGFVVVLEAPEWHRHEEYDQLNRDAEEAERDWALDDELSDEERGIPDDVRHLAAAHGPPHSWPMGETEPEMPTGQALLDQILADVAAQDEPPSH